jgi:TolA-binding protein
MKKAQRRLLKSPDEFIAHVRSGFEWATEQWLALLIILGLFLVALVVVTVGMQLRTQAEGKAQVLYSEMKASFEQTQLGSEGEKAAATEKMLSSWESLKSKHSGSEAYAMGAMLRAQSLLNEGRAEEASVLIQDFKRSLRGGYVDLALIPMAQALESQQKWSEAAELYAEVGSRESSTRRSEGLLGEARMRNQLGEKDKAQALYQKYLELYPESSDRNLVRGLMAEAGVQ